MTHVVKYIDGAITAHGGARRLSRPATVRTRWEYSTGDPLAVQVFIQAGRDEWVEWAFARDLLADGLIAEAGSGDVRISPMGLFTVRLELSNPGGYAALEFDAETTCEFLQETYDLILPGTEQVLDGVDRFLAAHSL
ncbi:SsgA family sporulation/cell division regulator [Pseudonocardiaceae bacterium YIM PH 21723]|nr:SsgA family sporulation/cell division regulator [Pseudonocardiaceae bacterium YIM PH 21723]